MSDRNKIVIVDDHPLFRDALRSIMNNTDMLEVAGEAASGSEALQLIKDIKPDLAILDIELKDMSGFEIVEQLYREDINTKIIFLTMHNDVEIFNKALSLSVSGYLLKENTSAEILTCINFVLAGNTYISPLLSDYMFKVIKRQIQSLKEDKLNQLTISEKRILKLISMNKTSKEIASELNISPKTVENHRKNICDKLALHGTHSLLKFAIEHKDKL